MSTRVRKVSLFIGPGVLALFSILVSLHFVEAQQPIAANTRPFEPTEELLYDAEFNRSLLRGLNVAEFKLRSARSSMISEEDKKTGKPYSLTFTADLESKGFFTRLFNLHFHEQIESTVDGSNFTLQKTTILDEQGKRIRATETTYDRSTGKMSWSQRDPNNPSSEPRRAVVDFSGQLQDVLSAVYFIRTHPLHVGKPFEIFIGENGHVVRIPVHVVEKKSMKTILGKLKVVRVEPQIFGEDKLIKDQDGEFICWITDDDRRIPVSARIKTDYGTFDIKLKRADVNKL
jgi:Protein of unknown function (DUF3108)